MKKILVFILFNLILLNGFGQVKEATIYDTVRVNSSVVHKVSKSIKKAINNHLEYLKEESYCINKKKNIMIINIKEFDTISPDKYIGLIDYSDANDENEKYVIGIDFARKAGSLMYQLNDIADSHYYFKYKGYDIYAYTQSNIKFNTKKKLKTNVFPIQFRKYILDEEGTLPYEYLTYILDNREYEEESNLYKLNKSDIEK